MFRPLALYVGLRYTSAKRKNHFISFISLASMLGLMLGVAALIVVLSVMNGFDRELRQRILGMVPHASIVQYNSPIKDWQQLQTQVNKHPDVLASAPFTALQGMLTHNAEVSASLVYGINPSAEQKVSILSKHMKVGQLEDLNKQSFSIILGEMLAQRLGVTLGDKVTLVLPEARLNIAGIVPRLKRFTLVGVFSVGAEVDNNLAYISTEAAAKLKSYPKGAVEGLRIKFADLFKAPEQVAAISAELPNYYLSSNWTQTQGNLFQAIQLEKNMIGLLLFLIVLVAAFNILSTLVMVVSDKKSDIAILRTLGASQGLILRIFMVQGSLIGLIGTFLGTLLGLVVSWSLPDIMQVIEKTLGQKILDPNVYFISHLPTELRWSDVTVIICSTLLISLLATIYPALRATKTQPAEALRYE